MSFSRCASGQVSERSEMPRKRTVVVGTPLAAVRNLGKKLNEIRLELESLVPGIWRMPVLQLVALPEDRMEQVYTLLLDMQMEWRELFVILHEEILNGGLTDQVAGLIDRLAGRYSHLHLLMEVLNINQNDGEGLTLLGED